MKQIIATALVLALAACQQGNDENIAIDETNSANATIETLPPDETVTNDADLANNSSDATAGALLIPAAFQGRWGMVPADCTSTAGDAKGLIIVDEDSIEFFESQGTLTKVTGNYP